MKRFVNPNKEDWAKLLKRPTMDLETIEQQVQPIMQAVKAEGDKALSSLTEKFDGVKLDTFKVSIEEFNEANGLIDQELKNAIQTAAHNIERFHQAQERKVLKVTTMSGVNCYRRAVAIEKVGLYIPGGTAPLFSTVLMLGIPAKIAGCEEVVLCTPPNKEGKVHPAILYTAQLIGIDQVFKVGGAQSIAALTYGTETIPAVYKIFGPGNQYVTAAKQLATKNGLAIDMPAGPSEVAVFANDTSNPAFVASDLLSQAEHGVDSQVLLVSTDEAMIDAVGEELRDQLALLPRAEMAEKALSNSMSVLFSEEKDAIELLNAYGAEHLILSVDDPWQIADQITNAGSIFLGHFTPESAGDYASGTNHTLPTNGYAKMYSGVSLDSFMKMITYQELSAEGISALGPTIESMAEAEELAAHKNAVTLRLNWLKDV